jgi:hypothetical protein
MRKETRIQKIVRLVARRYPSFGNGKIVEGNQLSVELADQSPVFAGGVDIEEVVRFILSRRNAVNYARKKKTGDDMRDYANTASYLRPLSKQMLTDILGLNRKEIQSTLVLATYPFFKLSNKSRETLRNLPTNWIYGAANWLLRSQEYREKNR